MAEDRTVRTSTPLEMAENDISKGGSGRSGLGQLLGGLWGPFLKVFWAKIGSPKVDPVRGLGIGW